MDNENYFLKPFRIILNIILVVAQLTIIFMILLSASRVPTYIYWTTWVIGVITALGIVCSTDKSSNKISWIVFILTLPSVGVIAYFLLGRKYIPKRINDKMEKIDSNEDFKSSQDQRLINKIEDKTHKCFFNILYNLSGYPVYSNTITEYFKVGEEMFDKMLLDIKTAEKFIFLEYYIVKSGNLYNRILDALIAKSQEGVEVILIYDAMGSFTGLPKNFKKTLQKSGIKSYAFNDFNTSVYDFVSFRDHRKLTIIDGNITYCGGVNIGDEYTNEEERFGHWKDMGVRIYGDASWGFTQIFLKMLEFVTNDIKKIDYYKPNHKVKYGQGLVVPYADGPTDRENPAETLYMKIISSARDYLYITTPYLILDSNFMNLLCLASRSGVDVRLIVPHIPDKKMVFRVTRSNYSELIQNGVKIYEYTPGFMHGKVFVSDDKYCVVGSVNLDSRSLTWNYESAVFIYGNTTVLDVKKDFLDTIQVSEEIKSHKQNKRHFIRNINDSILRLLAPLM